MARLIAPVLLIVAATECVRAHEHTLTPSHRAAVERAAELLDTDVDGELARRVGTALACIPPKQLGHLSHTKTFRRLSADHKRRLSQAISGIRFANRHRGHLEDPWTIGVQLASSSKRDQYLAIQALAKLPLNASFLRILADLVMHREPVVRRGAGHLAKVYSIFKGADDTCRAIAKRLLVDRDPNVAAFFAVHDAYEFQDLEITDLMVARMRDRRASPSDTGSTPAYDTVGRAIQQRLAKAFFGSFDAPVPAADIAAWWKRHRKTVRFDASPRLGNPVAQWKGKLKRGGDIEVASALGKLHLTLVEYVGGWHAARPLFHARIRFRPQNAPAASVIDARHVAAFNSTFSDVESAEHSWSLEYLIVPHTCDAFLVRVRVWKRKDARR